MDWVGFTVDYIIPFSYILFFVAVVGALLVGPIIGFMNDPKGFLRSLVGVGAIVVIFIIGYAMASDAVKLNYAKFGVDGGLSKLIDGSIITTYILFGITIVGIVYSEVAKIFR